MAAADCWEEAGLFRVEVAAGTRGVARATPEAVRREAPATGRRDDGVGRRLIVTDSLKRGQQLKQEITISTTHRSTKKTNLSKCTGEWGKIAGFRET